MRYRSASTGAAANNRESGAQNSATRGRLLAQAALEHPIGLLVGRFGIGGGLGGTCLCRLRGGKRLLRDLLGLVGILAGRSQKRAILIAQSRARAKRR